jgi:hypothetical protein
VAPPRYPHTLKSSATEPATRIQRLYGGENPLPLQPVYDLAVDALRALREEPVAPGAGHACRDRGQ